MRFCNSSLLQCGGVVESFASTNEMPLLMDCSTAPHLRLTQSKQHRWLQRDAAFTLSTGTLLCRGACLHNHGARRVETANDRHRERRAQARRYTVTPVEKERALHTRGKHQPSHHLHRSLEPAPGPKFIPQNSILPSPVIRHYADRRNTQSSQQQRMGS